jgi:hypothetical protein
MSMPGWAKSLQNCSLPVTKLSQSPLDWLHRFWYDVFAEEQGIPKVKVNAGRSRRFTFPDRKPSQAKKITLSDVIGS